MHRGLLCAAAVACAACFAERQPFTNRMARTGAEGETSYLSRAARQPVDWQPWDREAFALAAKLDRPILLYVGGDDCRSCDEGDRTIYTDPQIASLINALFVPVRVDRDERPDIARRYQAAVERMAGLRGWPLTVFLTADGSPFFGGTFFPADDPVTGRGLKQILPEVAQRYRDQRPALLQQAARLRQLALADRDTRGVLRASVVREHIEGLIHELDRATRAGPVGASVTTAEAASLLLTEYTRAHDSLALRVAARALGGMLDSAAVRSDEDDPRLVRAALAGALAKAWVATGDARYREYGRAMAQQLARDAPSPRFADREAFIIEHLMLAGATLGEPSIVARARARFDVLLRHAYAKGWGVRHTFTSAVSPGAGIGLLQDQVQVGSACLAARQLTGDRRYLEIARDLVAIMDRDYADSTGGYDDAVFASAAIPDVVNDRTKQVLDDALPGANAVAASVLARLAAMTGDIAYRRRAQATLDAFAGAIRGGAVNDLRATTYLGAAREVVGAQ